MALSSATLASELDAETGLTIDEASARAAWAKAWVDYFYNATANAVPVAPGSLATAQTAMANAMTGLSTAGATAIQAGIAAFWATITPLFATVFPGSIGPLVAPPTVGGIAAALPVVFAANVSGALSKTASLNSIATVLHTNGGLGGTVTFPLAVVAPIL